MPVPVPDNEAVRLDDLRALAILDTAAEQDFDDLVLLAAQACGTPIALMTLVSEDRQWFKARIGLDAEETPRDVAFCAHAILEPAGVMVVSDARRDDRFAANPLVLNDPAIRFYAGAPLVTTAGNALGTICVIDQKPRTLDSDQIATLQVLSRLAASRLEAHRAAMTDGLTGLWNRRALRQEGRQS